MTKCRILKEMMENKYILQSWKNEDNPFYTTDEILSWIKELNEATYVSVEETSIYNSDF